MLFIVSLNLKKCHYFSLKFFGWEPPSPDLGGWDDDPHGEDLEGEEAGEEEDDHGAEHQDNLAPAPGYGPALHRLRLLLTVAGPCAQLET